MLTSSLLIFLKPKKLLIKTIVNSLRHLWRSEFTSAKIEDEMMEEFIKNVYRIIKSGGNIIMIRKKESSYLKLWQILEENFFVAINSIELSDDYNLLIGKKMHGWGG